MIVSVPALMGAFEVGAPDDAPAEVAATVDGAVPEDEAAVADELAEEGAAAFFAFDVQAAKAAEPATMPAPLRKERRLTCV